MKFENTSTVLLQPSRNPSDLTAEESAALKKLLDSKLPKNPTVEQRYNFLRDFYGDLLFSGSMRDTLLKVAETKKLKDSTFEYGYEHEGTLGMLHLVGSPVKLIAKVNTVQYKQVHIERKANIPRPCCNSLALTGSVSLRAMAPVTAMRPCCSSGSMGSQQIQGKNNIL